MALTKVTYSMISGAPANVLDYGADPTGATSSVAAIQAAIDENPDGCVFFPVGTYLIDAQVDMDTGVSLSGYGATLSITTASSSFVYGATAVCGPHVVEGFTIQGDGTTTLNRAVFHSVSGSQISGATYQDLYFDSVSFGIYVNQESAGNNTAAKIVGCRFVNIFDTSDGTISGRGLGVAFSGGLIAGRPPLRGLVDGCTFTNTGRHAVYVSSGNTVTVSNNSFYEHRAGGTLKSYPLPALNISRCQNIVATGNTFIGNTDACVAADNGSPSGTCSSINVLGNTFIDNSTYIFVVGTDDPDTNGLVTNVSFNSNVIKHKNDSAYPPVYVEHCNVLTICGNQFSATDLTVSLGAMISLYGFGSTVPSNNYFIRDNTIIMPTSGIATSRGVSVNTNICSGTMACIISNNDIVAIEPIYLASGQTNQNLLTGRKINFPLNKTLTVAAGVIAVTANRHYVATEGGAGTDDLDTINGGEDGQLLVLSSSTSGQDVTLKDGTGNLRLAGDYTLTAVGDTITLIYDTPASLWFEVSRSDNV